MSARTSRFRLYEACTQNPSLLVQLLRAIHAGTPRLLREDFCGSAAVSREWTRSDPRAAAFAIDIDPVPLAFARSRRPRRTRFLKGNALSTPTPRGSRADIIFVGNFSIGELHDRPSLLRYLCASRARLAKGGAFICDTYGGSTAFARGSVQRTHTLPSRASSAPLRVRYTWEQREADPLTGMVTNAIHFRVEHAGEVIQTVTDAFVYHWRLWSIAELREAMREAGFRTTAVYADLPDARDSDGRSYARPIESPDELPDSYIVCVAGRA